MDPTNTIIQDSNLMLEIERKILTEDIELLPEQLMDGQTRSDIISLLPQTIESDLQWNLLRYRSQIDDLHYTLGEFPLYQIDSPNIQFVDRSNFLDELTGHMYVDMIVTQRILLHDDFDWEANPYAVHSEPDPINPDQTKTSIRMPGLDDTYAVEMDLSSNIIMVIDPSELDPGELSQDGYIWLDRPPDGADLGAIERNLGSNFDIGNQASINESIFGTADHPSPDPTIPEWIPESIKDRFIPPVPDNGLFASDFHMLETGDSYMPYTIYSEFDVILTYSVHLEQDSNGEMRIVSTNFDDQNLNIAPLYDQGSRFVPIEEVGYVP